MTLDWWNFEESVAGFFVHCIAIAGLYMFLTYYAMKWIQQPKAPDALGSPWRQSAAATLHSISLALSLSWRCARGQRRIAHLALSADEAVKAGEQRVISPPTAACAIS